MSSSPAEAEAGRAAEPGAQFLGEIREQPQALLGLLEHEREFARVAATARSSPAPSGSTASASCASSEPGSFVTATVKAPPRRAWRRYSTTSGVCPDWDSATTVEPDMSSGLP